MDVNAAATATSTATPTNPVPTAVADAERFDQKDRILRTEGRPEQGEHEHHSSQNQQRCRPRADPPANRSPVEFCGASTAVSVSFRFTMDDHEPENTGHHKESVARKREISTGPRVDRTRRNRTEKVQAVCIDCVDEQLNVEDRRAERHRAYPGQESTCHGGSAARNE